MGGPATPGIGFGIGLERVMIACDAEDVLPAPPSRLDAFVVDALGDGDATVLVNELREAGLRADRAYGGRSMKAQMKVADRARARFAVLLAPDEAKRRMVKVRDLVAGDEVDVHREQIAGWLRERSA